MLNFDFVAPDLDFVAPGLDFVARDLDIVAPGLEMAPKRAATLYHFRST
jgi:hypothetical protein